MVKRNMWREFVKRLSISRASDIASPTNDHRPSPIAHRPSPIDHRLSTID